MTANNAIKQKIEKLLKSCGVNTTSVLVLGKFVHVDSFEKYDEKLQYIFTSAGFQILKAKNMLHLDGFNGYRISVKSK